MTSASLEADVQRIGSDLLEAAGQQESAIHPVEWFDARVMEWAMSDESLKVEMLRFIDVLPALHTPDEIARHLQEYFSSEKGFPVVGQWGIQFASHNPIAARATAMMVRSNAERMAHRFIAGSNAREVVRAVRRMRRQQMAFTVDVLGEATVSEAESRAYQERYLEAINSLCDEASDWKPVSILDTAGDRPSPRVNVSVKLSSLYSQLDPAATEASSRAVRDRLRPIFRLAMERGAAVTLDMEQYAFKNLTLQVLRDILDEPAFRYWGDAGIALQAYLTDTEADVQDLIAWARQRPAPISVRLVRGAYWDYETVIAAQREWPSPVYLEKSGTDRSYERCLTLLFDAYPAVQTAAATHNVRSIALAMALNQSMKLPAGAAEIQMLYGMADPIKRAVVERGWRLRVYTPYGELLPGMAYLVRRLLENTSNSSFLRLRYNEQTSTEDLLRPPAEPVAVTQSHEAGFRNTPDRNYSLAPEREAMAQAIQLVRSRLGRSYPLIVGGQEITTPGHITSVDPSSPSRVVGEVSSAGLEHVQRAVESAARAFPSWRDTPFSDRAAVLQRAAERMKLIRDELAAWEVFEGGKNWREADADVTESIDYLGYYAAEMLRLGPPRSMGHVAGEVNTLLYEPRGVVAVIPPWNFPLAILTGMTSAALVTGNTVVLKPASQTPVIGAHFTRLLHEAGLPPGVLNYLPGPGGEIGDALVDHPQIAMIAFTGSREVGLRICRRAAEVHPGQRSLKAVIAELGGKNALIVDSDADLDDAVLGAAASAFGYQGQKCSACSRIVVLDDVYDAFAARLVEAARSFTIGPAEDPQYFMGPVIDARSRDRILAAIERGKSSANVLLEVDASAPGDGYFIGPVIFGDVDPASALAQDEIFGPVLSLMRARNLDHALELANDSSYALTGGIYTRSPANLERVRREFRVGNLYLNRKITGAIVGRQPFGGFKMSGTDAKAGGPDYLQQFMLARTITENTLRRGFAPVQEEAAEGEL